jgi:ribosomal protein S18 acetylase RimI-like enzyme
MKILPLDSKLEPLFWKHVYRDIPDYFFFIADMKYDRDNTKITLALDQQNHIMGTMLIYRDTTVQLRGNANVAKTLLAQLDLGKIQLQAPLELSPLPIPNKYEVKKTFELTLMNLRKGEETPQVKHTLVRLSAADAKDIAAMMRAGEPDWWGDTTADQIRKGMETKERLWLGIKVDGKLASIGGTRLTDWASNIHTVATHEDYRNRGYAMSIVSVLVKEIFEKSDLALIHVLSNNLPAIRAYTKAGFKPYKRYTVVRVEKS